MSSLSLVLAVTILASASPAETFTVVVHPESRIASVSRAELSKIFLGRLRTWSDGTSVLPVDQLPERRVRARFSRQIHGRSVVTVEVYWKRMIFSGRGVPPDEVDDDRQVLEYVAARPGAVGYVAASTQLIGVRELPLED